jgi:hypothetical protein
MLTRLRLQVVDQYLSFIAPSGSLYSLLPPPPLAISPMSNQPGPSQQLSSYSILNSPSSTEDQIENEIERIAGGLFSVVATLGACSPVSLKGYASKRHQVKCPLSEHQGEMQQR